jgi:hypothetical protein
MKIIVENEQEKQIIASMCDIALKAGGLRNYDEVGRIMNSIVMAEPKTKKTDDENKP